ncbi:MAG TPA: tetratricopeptide repeat protein [Candidatus Limnocylindria bacterium]|jgi:predicted ATPase/class 3 adenylate cyclase|nr:tetratricopeptide repeat protein [Candidatus Limnocylindria bacterium]
MRRVAERNALLRRLAVPGSGDDTGGVTEIPTGTVTFVFTDIEGSTRLAQDLGAGWPPLLERHREIARAVWAEQHGVEIGTEGDSFFVVFTRAPQAVAAAVSVQRGLAAEAWPDGAQIRIRMGMHTGEGVLSGGGYVGLDVHRAARIANAGHGGQVLLSATTRALVEGSLPRGVTLREMGEHRLKDLSRPERIWDLVIEGMASDFPALRTLNAVPNNLPMQLTSFLGRQREIAEGRQLLIDGRLLTLTGPGGTGKTRLSLQIAADATDRFPDGIYFVPLGTISQSDLVLPTIAQVLGLVDPGTRPLDRLVEHIGAKCFLLVLDNFEQVNDAAPQIAELLARAPKISVLVTSRSPLRVSGEQEFPVPPLGVPDPKHLPDLEQLSTYESVALFTERAMAVRPDFTVTSTNAPAVAEVCVRLDGLPLAIELAAARVRVLSPQAIMERLGDRLKLLSGGSRDLPERHQTLRGAIAWSYDLLDEADKRVFARLAVFAGGATLEAIERVAFEPGDAVDPLDALTSLVDKSLVREESDPDGEPRFRMLSTIREFATERLEEQGEAEEMGERHAAWVLALVQDGAAGIFGPDQKAILDRDEREHDNIRAALARAIAHGHAEMAMQIFAASWRFWQMRGYLAEAREHAETVLALAGSTDYPDARAAALEAAGGIAYWQGELNVARGWYEEAVEIARASGDDARIANAIYNLSFTFTLEHEDQVRARALAKEAVEIYRRLGDEAGIARSLWGEANTYYFFRDFAGGIDLAQEALEIFRRLDDRFMIGWTLYMLALYNLTLDRTAMRQLLEEALPLFTEIEDKSGYGMIFDAFGALFWTEGDTMRAIRLAGYASALEASTGAGLARINRESADFYPAALTTDPALAAAFAEGQRMTVEEATELALRPG